MRVLVVYDSVFGNTERVAQAVGAALEPQAEVTVLRPGAVQPEHLDRLDALIAGSPTRAFRPTPAVRSWLRGLKPGSLKGVKVAAFDTRADVATVGSRLLTALVKVFGYAAEPIGRQLQAKGGSEAMSPAGFFVERTEGPLREGELERAAAWARQIPPAWR